ncbi:hypothetical protein C4544_03825 [candidate division WS5 bacterium]|uniref:Uncharacterized protein n=1 Tax=candidate division WS5 bacterium TaxID=2093353 RepID=A0A419DD30_9BACT|nr:MAG: hypothetical protein C4544_03825 [candidate division WS5 bacterium]
MLFIALYAVPAILILTGVGSFKIVGIAFILCYLPGLSFFSLAKKQQLIFEDLVLAFPISIGISGLLTLGLLVFGVSVKYIAYIIYALNVTVLFFSLIRCRSISFISIRLLRNEAWFIAVAFLATLILSVPVIAERIAISAHGFHHLSMVNQIINGIFPPENTGLGGTSISYHWGYHALVAVLSLPLDINPLRVFSILNIISLFFIFCLAYRSAKVFGFSEGYSFLVPLALIGLMRSDASIYLVKNIVWGNFEPIQSVISNPLEVLSNWVSGISYIDRRLFFINKFYNANNMPLGICLVMSLFMLLLLMVEREKNSSDIKTNLASLSIVLIAIAVTYAFFLIVPLLFIPLWSIVLFITNPGRLSDKLKEGLLLLAPCAVAMIITAPYLIGISQGPNVMTMGQNISEYKFFYWDVQAIRNLVVYLLPSPLIALGYWLGHKQLGSSRRMLFILHGSSLFLFLSIFLRLQWYNEEKFSFLLSFFFSLMFVYSLTYLFPLFSRTWLKKVATVLIIVFLLSTPLITEAAYLCSPWFRDKTYAFNGRHVKFAKDEFRNEAYLWIRENTSPDSLIMLPYLITPYWDNTAHIASYQPSVISERNLFIIKDVYAFMSPEYKDRVRVREQLFENPLNPRVRQYLSSLNRSIYLLIEEIDDPLLEGVVFDRVPINSVESFLLVFETDRQRVYKILYDNSEK